MVVLAASLAYRVAVAVLDVQPTGVAARALLPVHALGSIQRTVIMAAPASCIAALCTWNRLSMPGSEKPIGQWVVRTMWRILFGSLAIIFVMAFFRE